MDQSLLCTIQQEFSGKPQEYFKDKKRDSYQRYGVVCFGILKTL